MECTCPSQNLISDVLLCFLIPFSEIVLFVSYQKGLFQYFVKSKWHVWICFHFICMLLLCLCLFDLCTLFNLYLFLVKLQGRTQDFKLGGGGAHLKKFRRAEGGAKIFGVFRVKNHDFTQKNQYFFPILGGGGGAGCAPPWIRPWVVYAFNPSE